MAISCKGQVGGGYELGLGFTQKPVQVAPPAKHVADWPLQDVAITNIVWCMAYKGGVGMRVVYCAIVVHTYCNGVNNAGGGGTYKDD